MRVHLIKKQAIEGYVAGHAASKSSFEYWVTAVKYADWDQPLDIQQTFGTADMIGNGSNRVVFDIGGNTYRMICRYHFGITKVRLFVCWIGTHTEYDELCGRGDQYSVFDY
ncbi:MAG: type II toxin-antitoxin system HigB family toxin [Bacteroidetes bacterium]|nr:type II toxin-antitoxin system HigB family toxin [Bacteroidota bacterium]